MRQHFRVVDLSTSNDLPSVCARLERKVREGRWNELEWERRDLQAFLESLPPMASAEGRLLLTARLIQVLLYVREHGRVDSVLATVFPGGEAPHPDCAPDQVVRDPSELAASRATEKAKVEAISNETLALFLHVAGRVVASRRGSLRVAERLLKEAEGHLKRAAKPRTRDERTRIKLTQIENALWRGIASWRQGHHEDSDSRVRRAIDDVLSLEGLLRVPAVDLVAAVACDFASTTAWLRGHREEARLRATQACFFATHRFGSRRASRLCGHVRYSLSRAEATSSTIGFSFSMRLAHSAAVAARWAVAHAPRVPAVDEPDRGANTQPLRPAPSVCELKAMGQEAQSAAKANDHKAAISLIEEIRSHLGNDANTNSSESDIDTRDRALLLGDCLLTEIWCARRRKDVDWNHCRFLAQRMREVGGDTERLRVEADLHEGIAAAMSRNESEKLEGRRLLVKAANAAKAQERTTLRCAALLGLSESYADRDGFRAKFYYDRAIKVARNARPRSAGQLAPEVRGPFQSTYLSEWVLRLLPRLPSATEFPVVIPKGQPLAELLKGFEKLVLKLRLSEGPESPQEFADMLGVNYATGFSLIAKHSLHAFIPWRRKKRGEGGPSRSKR